MSPDNATCRCPEHCLLHPLWVTVRRDFSTLVQAQEFIEGQRELGMTNHHLLQHPKLECWRAVVIRPATEDEIAQHNSERQGKPS